MEITEMLFLFLSSVLFLLLLLLLLHLFFFFFKHSSIDKNLPPGPSPLPIIGNLLQLGSKPHSTLAKLAQFYGPLFSLRLGSQLVVVASSSKAASEVLKAHDNVLSGRYIVYHARSKNYVEHSMVWAPECTDIWKNLRRICRLELFSSRAMEAQSSIKEMRVQEMVGILREKEGEVVKVGEVVFGTIFNVLGSLIFSKFDMKGSDDEDDGGEGTTTGNSSIRDLKGHFVRMMEEGSAVSLGDCFPKLGWMFGGRKVSEEGRRNIFESWKEMIRMRRSDDHHNQQDFLSSLIKEGFNDNQINALLLEIFGAGSDTTTSTIEWAMVEIMKNPLVLRKLRFELKERLKMKNTTTPDQMEMVLKEIDLPHLPYLQAIVKETLRLHPPTPLLLPHRALQTCKVMNYTIPKECQILVNVWAIGRDPKIWDNALTFLPERFLDSQVDYKGNHFELVPFGGGRRICPGIPLASQLIPLIVASLVHNFDWGLPNGMSPHNLSTEEKFGLTLQKDPPLLLVPKALKID